ncbi:hypothetical protein F383_08907 [Gossypium arboreum]|uniref:Uncharacterized protein n=1 Tax=Gossypium arboreum TaxID=29729 RepID=A0A0B0PCV3_GOSAR|nr:hypothetical protein F383_08907 [Gossypium arboreum]
MVNCHFWIRVLSG